MKYCPKCKLSIAGERDVCPLCHGKLSGEKSDEVFPMVPTVYREFNFLFKVLIFLSVAGAVACVAINLLWKESGWWSLFCVAGAACLWALLAVAVRKRKNIPRWILYQIFIISVICGVWDLATGKKGWSIDYAIPILCLAGLASLAVLSRVLKWKADYFIVAFCVTAFFGIVPFVFYLTGLVKVPYPTVICMAGSVISLAAIAVFKGESMIEEIKRWFYV